MFYITDNDNIVYGMKPIIPMPYQSKLIYPYSGIKCHPHGGPDWKKECEKMDDGWYDFGFSGGAIIFNVKDHELQHYYIIRGCNGGVGEEYHKQDAPIDWEPAKSKQVEKKQ